jgi:hypothetical protein
MTPLNIQYSRSTPNDFILDYEGNKFKFNIQLFLSKLAEVRVKVGSNHIIPIYSNFKLQVRSTDEADVLNLVIETHKNASPLQINVVASFTELEKSLRNLTDTPTTLPSETLTPTYNPNLPPPIFPVSANPPEKVTWFLK